MTDELARTIAELADRQQITDVILTAARAGDRADLELLKSCYHPDAHEDHGYFQGNAYDFAEQAVVLQREHYESANHYLNPPLIELDGDHAYVETYVRAIMIGNDEEGRYTLVFAGRYLDTFERREGRWAIAQRITVNDYASTERMPGAKWPWGDDPVFVGGAMDRSDPVYLIGSPEELRSAPRR